ncbi:MAG TPA: SelB C-terminal domain-containing protein, partial [Dehalococcoidia bacterium]|nr:SelB C-terminal domain-containing protein [Dehalococcoidia bacterium]
LAGEAAVAKGDYFVIRDPNDTLGGGKIVDVDVRRHKRFHAPLLEALARLEEGSPGEQVLLLLERGEPLTIGQISQEAQLNEETVLSAAAGLIQQGKLVSLEQGALQRESVVLSKESLERLSESARQALQAYHREFPLRPGMPREDLRGRLGLEGRAFEQALDRWQEEGWLRGNASWARLSEHEPTLSPPQVESKSGLLAALRANPFAPELNGLPDPDLLAYLEERGEIVRASESVIFSAEAYRQMTERVLDHLQANGSITLAQVRDMFGNSRKYAQALLERLDRQRVTRRVGDERVLRQ